MEDWIKILVAFVNDDSDYDFGTKTVEQMIVATPEGRIEMQHDRRWDELERLGEIFAGVKS
jgi:uncharacterized protein YaiE (UPF0345 family)